MYEIVNKQHIKNKHVSRHVSIAAPISYPDKVTLENQQWWWWRASAAVDATGDRLSSKLTARQFINNDSIKCSGCVRAAISTIIYSTASAPRPPVPSTVTRSHKQCQRVTVPRIVIHLLRTRFGRRKFILPVLLFSETSI